MDIMMMLVSHVRYVSQNAKQLVPTVDNHNHNYYYYYSACVSGSIRLVGGTVPWEGRVEVCKDESWGTVCDDFWSTEDATVACRWAGFSPISQLVYSLLVTVVLVKIILFADSTALSRAAFGLGTGPIHFDDLRCTGNEGTLFDCPFTAQHNCNHFEDAGVRCLPDGQYNEFTS